MLLKNIILYSESGNITIENHSNINFRGLIYALNGTITIHANNLNIDGTILAENINLDANVININNQSTLSNYIMSQPKLEDTQIGDYTFEYDAFGTTESVIYGGNAYVKYYYTDDLSHKLNKIQYINGDSEEYCYNKDGLLTGIRMGGKEEFDMEYNYDADGKLVEKMDYKNQLKTCYIDGKSQVYKIKNGKEVFQYEKESNLTDILPEAAKQDILVNGTDLTYTYEWNQNTVSEKYRLKDSGDISEIQKDGKSIFYTYDAKRQLIRVDNQNTNMSCVYSYDDIGNIVKKESYQYDNGTQGKLIDSNSYNYSVNFPDRMTNFNGNEIQYDEMGNPTKYSDWLMKWEQGKKLTELTNLETTIQYKYDDINRIAKIVNGVETDFQYINNKISYQKDEVNTLEFQLNNKYEYIGFSLNEENYIYVKNLLGDIIAIEDFAGHTICTYEYDSWGNITQISGDQEVGELNPIRYREYYFDKETGFYNLGSRYYDPETARFINADELYLCIDNNENMYKYCENNPMYYIDDSGYYAMQNSHVIDQVKTTVYNYINSEKDNIPTDDKYLIATVAGEAVGENKTARRAVASAIVNRTVERFRSNGSFKSTISWSSQYSSYLSSEYNKCMKYLNSRNGKSTTYESLIGTCLKVGYRIISDITKGCKFFYSPQSMPGGKAPNWVIPSAEVKIDNIDRNHFRFYTKAK